MAFKMKGFPMQVGTSGIKHGIHVEDHGKKAGDIDDPGAFDYKSPMKQTDVPIGTIKGDLIKVAKGWIDVSSAEGRKFLEQSQMPTTRSTTFDADELARKNRERLAREASEETAETTTKKVVKEGSEKVVKRQAVKKASKSVIKKALTRLIPYAGWALAAHDVYKINQYMGEGMSLGKAIKKHYLGLD